MSSVSALCRFLARIVRVEDVRGSKLLLGSVFQTTQQALNIRKALHTSSLLSVLICLL